LILSKYRRQWLDDVAGRIVAEAILLHTERESPVAVGFGGTHYAPSQTALIFETDVAFGHIFPSHTLDLLDEEMIHQAFTRSKADFAYIDRKSMKAQQRERLSAMNECVDIIRKKYEVKDSVFLDGKTINPEMVYKINIRAIKLNYEKAIEE
jgi:D-aminoacyl-tRNA deacylase